MTKNKEHQKEFRARKKKQGFKCVYGYIDKRSVEIIDAIKNNVTECSGLGDTKVIEWALRNTEDGNAYRNELLKDLIRDMERQNRLIKEKLLDAVRSKIGSDGKATISDISMALEGICISVEDIIKDELVRYSLGQ